MDSIDLVSKHSIHETTINDSNCVTSLMISAINPSTTASTTTIHKWSEEAPRRRLLESEDSSYDSDYENNDYEHSIIKKLPSLPSLPPLPSLSLNQHEEVVRTISDTLGAEFDEYVTASPLPRQTLLDVIINDANYTSRVEFGLKLGYTETQVQIALMKLGPQALQNELLGELIKLDANSSSCGINSPNNNNTVKTNVSSFNNDIPNGDDNTGDNSDSANLRPIVIDGSNVAISHGNKECFSCMGIKICVEWFKARGHREITVFVPMWRKEAPRPGAPIKDQEILLQLEAERLLVFTPSRNVGGRRMVCYDDRYILKLASQNDGIVVSNDNYRDLTNESPEYKKVVEERLLMYSFVKDCFMPPDDPLGRHGPSLNNYLRKIPKPPEILPPPCPYGKKCTYGNKCKYYHPERGNQPQKSVTERLAEQAKIHIQEVKARAKVTYSLPLHVGCDASRKKLPLSRTKSMMPTKSLPFEEERNYQPYFDPLFSQFVSNQNQSAGKNLHKKLQRQLTLNPNYDPRLLQMKHGLNPEPL